jgi:hypothetical protein
MEQRSILELLTLGAVCEYEMNGRAARRLAAFKDGSAIPELYLSRRD